MYPVIQLHIDGIWCPGGNGRQAPVLNPATGDPIGQVPIAEVDDLDRVAVAAEAAFHVWRKVPAFERYKLLRRTADLLRQRIDSIAMILTLEQGKPLGQAKEELNSAADCVDWFAEEARRSYGRLVPGRLPGVTQLVVKEPVGPVAAFTPWNFPVSQSVRKIAAALAAGCSIVLKGSEETPASCAALVQAFLDAGLPSGVLNLVFGIPHEISEHLIAHPAIRKVSFTGSTAVGKHLAALAGKHMKRATMELGGHAPAVVFADADVEQAVKTLAVRKFRNAGQICIAGSRFLVHESIYDTFLEKFVAAAKSVKVGDGFDPDTTMGPLANIRRLEAMEALVADAVDKGARIETGGKRLGNRGYFFEPTVLTDVSTESRIMNEEPFGPVAPILRFDDFDTAMREANRLPYGLAAYAFTRSSKTAAAFSTTIESGMVSINHQGLGPPETPFGGVKDSGYGSEGGSEAIEAYLNTKFVSQVDL